MEAYAIYLSLVLVTGAKIEVGAVHYFDSAPECYRFVRSDEYYLWLDIRFGGLEIKKRDSICLPIKYM